MRAFVVTALMFLTICGQAMAANQSMIVPSVNPSFEYLTAQAFGCKPRRTCGKIRSCHEAVWYLSNCSWGGRLDGDSDGAPCESLCGSNN
jgi:hypothetical protein